MDTNTKYLFFISSFLLIIVFSSSCYYDNKDDLYDVVIIPGEAGACEFTTVSYATDLAPILEVQCNAACHNPTDRRGNIVLTTYNDVIPYVNDGSLLGSIQYVSGFVAMPPGLRMPTCDVDKIQSWINNGAPNN